MKQKQTVQLIIEYTKKVLQYPKGTKGYDPADTMNLQMQIEKYEEADKAKSSDIDCINLSDYAKKKLEYITGHCISRDFPNQQPTLEWVGAVLDLLDELKLR